jgi:hypothetical protein
MACLALRLAEAALTALAIKVVDEIWESARR